MSGVTEFPDRERVRSRALRALGDIRPVSNAHESAFHGQRTAAGRGLPQPYLVHFLLIDLLRFPSLGRWEKTAWSVPVEFRGTVFIIEHRKLGVGVFAGDPVRDNPAAEEVVVRIKKAIKVARPFFDWLASQAVARSDINVANNAAALFSRFEFLLRCHSAKRLEVTERRDEKTVTVHKSALGTMTSTIFARFELEREAGWLALAALDAFFSWTEHVFVLLAVLEGKATTGDEVAGIAESDWPDKFKMVLDIGDRANKRFFDVLVEIRRELRNFMGHGAFGKDGRAFHFHSTAGAVPVVLSHKPGASRFAIADATYFDDEAALSVVDSFISHLWSGRRLPARRYIQDAELELILPFASDGTYVSAMSSHDEMEKLVRRLHEMIDRAANMDW